MNKIINKLKGFKTAEDNKITYSQLFAFFIPLGTSTLLISISNMLLNRALGYIPDSEFYISSFTVARTLMLLFMSPVSVIALVVTTFTQNKKTFKKVTWFAIINIILLELWFVVMAFTPIGRFLLSNLYNLDGKLLDNAVISLKIISFLPVCFLVRNYFLGVAIKLRNTKFATIGSLLRVILTLILSLSMPSIIKNVPHEYIGGILLSAIITLEALVYALGVVYTTKGKILIHLVHSLKRQDTYSEVNSINYKKIVVFALPLILSYSMAQLLPSFSQSALALSQNKEVTLTIYAVSLSFINIVGAFNFQIPQLVVNHDTFNPKNKNIVRNFCLIIAGIMFLCMIIVAFTGLGKYLAVSLLKLSTQNAELAKMSFRYGLFYPASLVFMSYKRGKLIKIQKTALLVFERVIGTLISLILFVIIPLISWEHGAGMGILVLTVANFATGIFVDIIFKVSVKKNPELISRTLL